MKNKIRRKIAIVSGYSNELPAISNRLKPLIKEALSREFEVLLISPTSSKIGIEHKNLKEINLKRKVDKNKGLYIRALNEISSSYIMMKKVYFEKYDFVIITIPSIFNLIFLRSTNKKQFLDIRDVTWEYLNNDNLFEKFVKNYFRWLLKIKLKFADTIITTNNSDSKYFVNRFNMPKNNLYLLTNGIEREKFKDISKIEKNKNNKIIVSYIGNIGVAQNLEILLLAAKRLPEIEFNIIGSGRNLSTLKSKTNYYKLENVKVFGRLNWNDVLEIYKNTDILYAQLSKEFSSAIPSKLYEYLASGKCIIYGGYGEALKKLKNFENVFLVKPDNVDDLVISIKKIIQKNLYHNISALNKIIIEEKYIRENEVKIFFDKKIK